MKYLIALSLLAVASCQICCECELCCPMGCCPAPEDTWECCPDGLYCAATLADCPDVTEKTQLTKMAVPKQKQCDASNPDCPAGSDGPGGCCPNIGWECCPDGLWCAPTLADCPVVTENIKLAKMVVPKLCD